MNEHSHNFNDADDESEITLTTPRFDATEASHANPVVPLDAVAESRPSGLKAHANPRHGARRSWPLSAIIVGLLSVATIGGIATTVLRRPRATQPAPALDAPVIQQAEEAQPAQAPAAFEARNVSRTTRAARRTRDAQVSDTDQDDETFLPTEILRGGEDGERRGEDRGKGKRKKHDDGENDFGKETKRAKKSLTRLVDVLTGPR